MQDKYLSLLCYARSIYYDLIFIIFVNTYAVSDMHDFDFIEHIYDVTGSLAPSSNT